MDNIKKLYPAAPTANNLMKFEEVPVSNYTGIPDIKIPIAEIPIYNQGISMNVSLNYHPLNARPDDKASEVGLGWSLFAGGSITRTVRGTPDDQAVLSAPGGQPSIGILYDEFTSRFADKNYTRQYLDAQTTGIGIDPTNVQFRKLFYEGLFMSRFDTEYDLYQYNFMGYTGRFIIKKDSNNQLFVEKLDKNNIRIAISATNPTNNLEATAFIITDEMGNKYSFEILEKSIRSILSNKTGFAGYINTNFSNLGDINSAFHLSKISNASDIDLVKFNYYPAQQVFYTDYSQIDRSKKFPDDDIALQPVRIQFDAEIPAAQELNVTSNNTSVRSLKDIEVLGKGKISFTYLQGREDTNYTHPQQLQRLDKITIIDSSEKIIESYQFSYDYFWFRLLGRDIDDKRLSLSKITKYKADSIKEFDYVLDYYKNTANEALGKDHWDWFNCIKPTDNYLLAKEPSSSCMTINLLKSMKLPSGGLRVFDFGSNTYSYVGSEPVDPYENPDNWDSTEKEVTYTKTEKNIKKYFFTLNSPKTVEIQNINSQIVNYAWNLSFYRKVGNSYVMAGVVGPVSDPDPNYPQYRSMDFAAGEYYAQLSFVEVDVNFTGTVNFTATYKDKKNSNIIPYVLGGGIRINSISYYDKPAQYGTNQIPAKKVNFVYNDFSGSGKSSGALIFSKPVHTYKYDYNNTFVYPVGSGFGKYNYSNVFTIFSSENFIPVQKTQGADVGYQNVKVYETGNGESLYTYRSPIDSPNPEQVSSTFPPFVPVANYDYKRGLLIDEQKKDSNGVLQYKKSTQYNTYDTKKLTGISLRHIGSPYTEYIYAGHFKTYDAYISGCLNTGGLNPFCGTNDPASMIAITPIVEVVGKANQTYGENTEFYPSGGIFKTILNMKYNGKDYVTKQTSTSPDGSITENTYQYAHEKNNQKLINANMIGIPLETAVIKKQNASDQGKIISRTETKYDNAANLFPTSVISYDLQSTASTEVTYDHYDSKGNLQQYTTKDGISTVIIWGYNQTQPIAKITGAKLSDIQQSLISSIVNASDLDASNPLNEPALITALDDFRKNSNMANYQVTTYTYDPLIGVTSITPPSGIREVYIYDAANRLKEIRENSATGKLLKEFKYNYKN
ncbi:RHS repeat domain-containing protein [Chryseobacterium cheonjiense]|uniref:YD repeat-containing protein n=1 Tax=Chryseobacterium cheonjiense TaxID=2728845 RepID=A0A7Y0AA00_9FLAO|nr:hypothetical protein [Chryseobacterium cheonjiense]NML59414.1 hypothetical protein [Chryseobacterium cheonjiense]